MVSQETHPKLPPFNGGCPLNMAINATIPQVVVQINLSFDGMDNTISTFEHYKDVLNQARNHDVTTEDVLVWLLFMSFKCKVANWYRCIPYAYVTSWENLARVFIHEFDEVANPRGIIKSWSLVSMLDSKSIEKEFPSP